MAIDTDRLLYEIRALPEEERLRLLDAILIDIDKPDPEIDQVWQPKLVSDGPLIRLAGWKRCLMRVSVPVSTLRNLGVPLRLRG